MKIKTSEAFRIASRVVLQSHPITSVEEVDKVLDVLSVLRKEEEMAKMLEEVAEKEALASEAV